MTTLTTRHRQNVRQGEIHHVLATNHTGVATLVTGIADTRIIITGIMVGSAGTGTVLLDGTAGGSCLPTFSYSANQPISVARRDGICILPAGEGLRITQSGAAACEVTVSYAFAKNPQV